MGSEACVQILGGMFSQPKLHKNSATNALGGNLNGIRLNKGYCTILLAQYELANASGLALNTKPMLKI